MVTGLHATVDLLIEQRFFRIGFQADVGPTVCGRHQHKNFPAHLKHVILRAKRPAMFGKGISSATRLACSCKDLLSMVIFLSKPAPHGFKAQRFKIDGTGRIAGGKLHGGFSQR